MPGSNYKAGSSKHDPTTVHGYKASPQGISNLPIGNFRVVNRSVAISRVILLTSHSIGSSNEG